MKFLFLQLPILSVALLSIAVAEPAGHATKNGDERPKNPPVQAKPEHPANTAFLGVITARPPRIMTEQLGLKPNEGLVVVALAPDGPAFKAGLAVNDIITGVGDVTMHTQEDITRAISMHAPDDTVRLKLIRKGEPSELDITLGSRPAGSINSREIDKILRKLIEERIASGNTPKGMEQLAKGAEMMNIPTGALIRIVDETGCVELKTSGDHKDVVVRDKDDKIIWSGPWNNEEDKKSAPAAITQRFKDLDIEAIFECSRISLNLPGTRKAITPESNKASDSLAKP